MKLILLKEYSQGTVTLPVAVAGWIRQLSNFRCRSEAHEMEEGSGD